ncbi:MAG: PepSY-like domain-containing protein [Saprospiraceae bacterium]
MKKVLFFFVFTCSMTLAAQAAGYKSHPPQAVATAFQQKFPNVTDVDWSQEKNGEWEAEFEQNEVDMSANFSADGKWLETETEIKISELPAPVRTALTGKKIKEAARILRADGSTVYEAEVRGKDWLFDAQGKSMQQ